MKKTLDVMEWELKRAFAACGYKEEFTKVVLSSCPDLCKYRCNGATTATKAYKKKPINIASAVVEKLTGKSGHPVFKEAATVTPGFISPKLSKQFLSGYVNGMAASDELGLKTPERPETVTVDYGGASVAKPLHIGHLRTAIIGKSVKRMRRLLGHKMIGNVHLGSWGLQMGLIIKELRDREPELVYFDQTYTGELPSQAPFTISKLEGIYPVTSAKSREDETFKERAREATLKLQKGHPPYKTIWRHIMAVSMEDLKKNYFSLSVEFDLWKGKSDAESYIGSMIQMFIDRGLACESQGTLVVDVAEESDSKKIPPYLIRKSDGASLYAASDLTTIVERERDFHPDRYIYVVDKRQSMHFEQVFRAAKKTGIVAQDTPMIFLGFGTMNGKGGKSFKTRENGVMCLERLINEIDDAMYARIIESRTASREETRTTSRVVGPATSKYEDLSDQAGKDYVFDTERFAPFGGNMGPHILYTIVRVKSILSKYRDNGGSVSEQALERHILPPCGGSEKALIFMLSKYGEVLKNSFAEAVPYRIYQYIYKLASAFNSFYHDAKILSEEDEARKGSYIGLITLTKRVLETCIELLGIEASDHM